MMGLVLWCDLDDQKAVFWCEDHGDLAYYDSSTEETVDFDRFGAGDMVMFDVILERKIRKARNACIVEQKVSNGLQDALRKSAARNGSDCKPVMKTAEVLQFSAHFANSPSFRRTGNG